MNCETARELLNDYLDNCLEEEQKQKLKQHLAQCPDCRNELREWKRLREICVELDDIKAPEGLAKDVMAKIHAMPKETVVPLVEKKRGRFGWTRYKHIYSTAIAACVVLTIAATGTYKYYSDLRNQSAQLVQPQFVNSSTALDVNPTGAPVTPTLAPKQESDEQSGEQSMASPAPTGIPNSISAQDDSSAAGKQNEPEALLTEQNNTDVTQTPAQSYNSEQNAQKDMVPQPVKQEVDNNNVNADNTVSSQGSDLSKQAAPSITAPPEQSKSNASGEGSGENRDTEAPAVMMLPPDATPAPSEERSESPGMATGGASDSARKYVAQTITYTIAGSTEEEVQKVVQGLGQPEEIEGALNSAGIQFTKSVSQEDRTAEIARLNQEIEQLDMLIKEEEAKGETRDKAQIDAWKTEKKAKDVKVSALIVECMNPEIIYIYS